MEGRAGFRRMNVIKIGEVGSAYKAFALITVDAN